MSLPKNRIDREHNKFDNDNNVKIIDVVHKRAHAGQLFTASHYNAAVINAGTIDILFVTGSESSHTVFSSYTSVLCKSIVYENVTTSNNGTSIDKMNHNRNSSKTSISQVYHTPTVTDLGTQLDGINLIGSSQGGSGNRPSIGGVGGGFNSELILKPNTKYLLRITNISGEIGHIQGLIDWYEPTL